MNIRMEAMKLFWLTPATSTIGFSSAKEPPCLEKCGLASQIRFPNRVVGRSSRFRVRSDKAERSGTVAISRNIKGAHFAVGCDCSHHHLPKGAPYEPREVYRHGRSPGNDLGGRHRWQRQADHGMHSGNESGYDSG